MTSWVLIVDDEEMIRENLKAYLEDEGLDRKSTRLNSSH